MYMTANLAIPAFEPALAPADQAFETLFAGQSLSAGQAEALFAELVAGRLPEPGIAPRTGQHTEEVLREVAGYDDARIAALREKGVFG